MSGVQTLWVEQADADMRLDRWFRREFPEIGHGRLEKLLRTGQIRVDGKRAKSGQHLVPGQAVRVPPVAPAPSSGPAVAAKPPAAADELLAKDLAARVLHMDDAVLVLDKPAGLATQGGSGIARHVDGALDGLRFGAAERPRLVHRLDKDTSGVLLLARTAVAARWLTAAFRHKQTIKTYWAVVVGEPELRRGRVDLALSKQPGRAGERMEIDEDEGKRAITDFAVIEQLGRRVAWVALRPLTGRTHQLRVHMAETGTPILGDGKYGGQTALLAAEGLSRKLHLHAREIRLTRPDGTTLSVTAPLPDHMARTWDFLGFSERDAASPFDDDDEG
jgi:23S rRNA pseudouridine955/2504/2580 synthase